MPTPAHYKLNRRYSQQPVFEHTGSHWRVWLSYNPSRTAGTYLVLLDDGGIVQLTQAPTGEITNTVTVCESHS